MHPRMMMRHGTYLPMEEFLNRVHDGSLTKEEDQAHISREEYYS